MATPLIVIVVLTVMMTLAMSMFTRPSETSSPASLLAEALENLLQQPGEAQEQGGSMLGLLALIFLVLAISSALGVQVVSLG